MSAHTPGPWRSTPPQGTDYKLVSIYGGKHGNNLVAEGVLEEDAPIIIASPRLAEALRGLLADPLLQPTDEGLCILCDAHNGQHEARCPIGEARAALREAGIEEE